MTELAALEAVNHLAKKSNQTAKEKGFWFPPDPRIAEINTKLLLIVSEVAEAQEALRQRYPGPVRMPTRMTEAQETDFLDELMDIVIRTFDLAEHLFGGRVTSALLLKMEKNTIRPAFHNKRF